MRYITGALHHRIIILILLFSLFSFSILGLFKLPITVDMQEYFLADDPAIVNQSHFNDLFGENEFVAVLFESDDVFSRTSLEKINEIGQKLQQTISSSKRLTHHGVLQTAQTGGVKLSYDSLGALLNSDSELQEFKATLLSTPSLCDNLFSADAKEAWILLSLTFPRKEEWESGVSPQFSIGALAYTTIQEIELSSTMKITPTGTAIYASRKKDEMLVDLIKILIVGALLTLALSILILKSPQAVFGTLSTIIMAIVITFGVSGWLKIAADSAFIAVPILLTTGVTIGYTVHITHFFNRYFIKGHSRKMAVVYALQHTWWPILFTVITTVVALISFLFIKITPIQWVGGISASCILSVYALTMFVYPIILSFGRGHTKKQDNHIDEHGFEGHFHRVSKFITRHQNSIVISFSLLTLCCTVLLTQISVDFSAKKMMGLKLPHMIDQEHIGKSQIGSNEFMDITISGPKDWLKDPRELAKVATLQKAIEQLPLVKKTSSIIPILKEVNRSQHPELQNGFIVPESVHELNKTYNILSLFSKSLLRQWISQEYDNGRIFIEMSDFSSKTIEDNIARIDSLVSVHLNDKSYFLSGSTYQMALMNQHITRGLLTSIASALIMITLLMMLIFRNIKLGLVAMIPNVLPVLFCGGLMSLLGIPLEFVTMTVAPLILGLSVDDTIHFIAGLKENILAEKDYERGIEKTLAIIGASITKTTIILCIVFLAFTISDVASMRNMGILAFSGILMAYLADILLTPILVRWLKPFKLDS